MTTIRFAVRLITAVVIAVSRRIVRRLHRGPIVPSWSWTLELRVVALRTLIQTAIRDEMGSHAQRGLEKWYDPPLPWHLRKVLQLEHGSLGGRDVDWISRSDPGLPSIATLLYFHGGGYVVGSPATHRHLAGRLAWSTGARTALVHYRLAPEHLFPAAVDDAVSAYRQLLGDGVDPRSIVLGGDSAGGGLSVATLLRLRDEGIPLPAGAMLFSPYVDLEHTGGSIQRNAETDYLPLGEIRPHTAYLGDADPRHPYASPVHGDFTGLPPLLVFAGGREMILDDAERLVAMARRDAVDVEYVVEPDMVHVWPAVVPGDPAARNAVARCGEFVRRVAAG